MSIINICHRSLATTDGLLLAGGLVIRRDSASLAGFDAIYDRMLNEIVPRMRRMGIDKTEISCLKAVVLLNPGEWCLCGILY